MTQIAPQIIQVTKAASAAGEMFKVIDREPAIDSLSKQGSRPNTCTGGIQFSNVSFSYPSRPDVPILQSLNLSIPAEKPPHSWGVAGQEKAL